MQQDYSSQKNYVSRKNSRLPVLDVPANGEIYFSWRNFCREFRRMNVRNRSFLAAAAVATVFLLAAGAAFAAAPVTDSPRKASLKSRLRQPISCDFATTPLGEVLDYFRTALRVNIVYDPTAEAAEALITLHVTEMPAYNALNWVVEQAGLSYALSEDAVYIASRERVLLTGRVYFQQYPVSDLLTPLVGKVRRDNDDNNDEDDDEDEVSSRTRAARELMALIVLFTGGLEQWDHVEVIDGAARDEDDSESREDLF